MTVIPFPEKEEPEQPTETLFQRALRRARAEQDSQTDS
jgi:hypothetical protein